MIKPTYYNRHSTGTDVIRTLELLRGKEAAKEFCIGNIIKYTIRFDKKNGVEDLEKAETYLARLKELVSESPRNTQEATHDDV